MVSVVCGMLESREASRWLMEHTDLKTSWIQYQMRQKDGFLAYPPPFSASSSSPPYASTFNKGSTSSSSPPPPSSGTRISPAVLFIIVILAVLFFISGLLHLLVRFLIKHPSSPASPNSNRYPALSGSDVLQRQLQQLFNLHDSGLDQAFIDALPVFQYKEIVGLKEPFDCAVCLCEFTEKDKLRLLPMCSHAFHISCIDTWLLSNSSCPLCRGALYTPGFSIENPMFDFDDLGEDEGCPGNGENRYTASQKTLEIEEAVDDKGVLPVRLGKFKKLSGGEGEAGGESSSSNLDARRCFSMGSYQYVVGDSDLRVALCNEQGRCNIKLTKEVEQIGNPPGDGDLEGKKISNVAKGDSFSISKIWLWPKKGKFSSSTDTHIDIPSSLNIELPWMNREQEQ